MGPGQTTQVVRVLLAQMRPFLARFSTLLVRPPTMQSPNSMLGMGITSMCLCAGAKTLLLFPRRRATTGNIEDGKLLHKSATIVAKNPEDIDAEGERPMLNRAQGGWCTRYLARSSCVTAAPPWVEVARM